MKDSVTEDDIETAGVEGHLKDASLLKFVVWKIA